MKCQGETTTRPVLVRMCFFFLLRRADEKAPSPATCVRVSILDFGHPLRGGSSMGQGGTAKAVLCFAIIHLGEERERKGKKNPPLVQRKKNIFHSIVIQTAPSLAWDYNPRHLVLLNFSILKKKRKD